MKQQRNTRQRQLVLDVVRGRRDHPTAEQIYQSVREQDAFNAMNPEYIGMLTLMVEPGTPLYDWVHDGSFRLLDQHQVLKETELLVSHFDSPGSVFRMNHASNYLDLRGTLNQDRDALLAKIHQAEQNLSCLRPESWRGL